MTTGENGTAGKDTVGAKQMFMALPARTDDGMASFRQCLVAVVDLLGIEVVPEPHSGDQRRWVQRARAALRKACRDGLTLSDASFDVLIKAAVHDPDPSFNRQFIEPALNAFGRWRVRAALLDHLLTGTDEERAGAARAWYWSALPLQLHQVRAETPTAEGQTEPDDPSLLTQDWHQAALKEFVSNEHLNVRRCLIPGLPLWRSAYPPELHDLVDAAVSIARSHPDEYIRHRVEHQVRA
ncbi:hypothetical protein [Nonomuraea sp. NPDC049684]|uniref:hypothetical protein n=1 Tax=Nonomuraea sp. NPDC049684 TaxID=3364356 RepID=UPI0037B51A40